jgi:hypothetical protein
MGPRVCYGVPLSYLYIEFLMYNFFSVIRWRDRVEGYCDVAVSYDSPCFVSLFRYKAAEKQASEEGDEHCYPVVCRSAANQ